MNLLPTVNAMNCPYCLDVLACAANEVPKVDCTGYIVNRTVLTLGGIFQDLTAYTTPDTVYSCVEVNFRRDENSSDILAIKGCTAGRKSICGEPTFDYNGILSCRSYSGADRHQLSMVLLLNMAIIAFALLFVS
ncbi:uncharacterized protein LOC118461698 isoform X2 [Anopheles albimanus]|uniref:uncharacterized protein LOC118461698 isoform X2 n=1 Tax=Anopheles albimanus TaxID=7167 RepID=UPI001641770C|nr:uncharacterized protein LOC118461698 isoform X2 [Anopheles albimanus]